MPFVPLLPSRQIEQVKRLLLEGWTYAEVSEAYEISERYISQEIVGYCCYNYDLDSYYKIRDRYWRTLSRILNGISNVSESCLAFHISEDTFWKKLAEIYSKKEYIRIRARIAAIKP